MFIFWSLSSFLALTSGLWESDKREWEGILLIFSKLLLVKSNLDFSCFFIGLAQANVS